MSGPYEARQVRWRITKRWSITRRAWRVYWFGRHVATVYGDEYRAKGFIDAMNRAYKC